MYIYMYIYIYIYVYIYIHTYTYVYIYRKGCVYIKEGKYSWSWGFFDLLSRFLLQDSELNELRATIEALKQQSGIQFSPEHNFSPGSHRRPSSSNTSTLSREPSTPGELLFVTLFSQFILQSCSIYRLQGCRYNGVGALCDQSVFF